MRLSVPRRVAARSNAAGPHEAELRATAKYISARGRGILASDESNMTTGKRLDSVGVDNTEDNRRAWRQLLYSAPGLGQVCACACAPAAARDAFMPRMTTPITRPACLPCCLPACAPPCSGPSR